MPLLVVAAGLLAYHNSLKGPFIFDDRSSILENQTIRHLWPIWQALSPPHKGGLTVEGRPLINFSLAVNYALGGQEVWGYHALNVIVHILAGLTLLGVVRRTLRQPRFQKRFDAAANGLALATAVIWTVHPLQTESITYIVQRAESIMGLFYLLTLYCFIRGAESTRPRGWYSLCVAACALGMASKEVMASAPLMVMLYDRTFCSGSFREAWRRRWLVYLALASTWILLGYLVFFTGSFSNERVNAKSQNLLWQEYLLTEPGVMLHYLRLSVLPHPLCFDYFGWPMARAWTSILPPALVVGSLLGMTVWACVTNSVWGVIGACFFLILAPTSSFLPLDSPAYEHRMYLPLTAVVLLVVLGVHALAGRRSRLVFLAMAVALGLLTVRRNHDYRSKLAIWSDTAAKRPHNARAHYNLGNALFALDQVSDAMVHYELAVRLMPDSADAHYNLGNALLALGGRSEAMGHFEQAVRIKPDFAEAHMNLGVALSQAGNMREAMGQFEQAVRLNPDSAEAHNDLGNALLALGKVPEAVGHLDQAVRLLPDSAEAHFNLGVALAQAGKLPEAVGQYEQALRIKPRYAEAQNNLARLLATLAPADGGDPVRAVSLAQQACELTGNRVAAAVDTLAIAYAAGGRFDEAIATAQKAIDLARSAGQPQLAGEIAVRLEMYRGGRPYRQAANVMSPRSP